MKKLIIPAVVLLALTGCASEPEPPVQTQATVQEFATPEPTTSAEDICDGVIRMHETADSYYPEYNTELIAPELKITAEAAEYSGDEDLAQLLSTAEGFVASGNESLSRVNMGLVEAHCNANVL